VSGSARYQSVIERNRPVITVLLCLAFLGLSMLGCGDDGASGEPDIPGGADPEDVRVIDDWSDALREGDVEGAADYFALPSIAQNGTPPIPLETRGQVVAFNEALPCGAELVEAEQQDEFVIATFELTERPGEGECGAGVGNEAKTAFLIEDGLIAEWRRVVDDEAIEPEPEGPIV
jgi:hypothetical protein